MFPPQSKELRFPHRRNPMNIGIVQLNTIIGDVENNVKRGLESIKQLASGGADIVVLPELFITGYPPRDLLHRKDLITANLEGVQKLIDASKTYGVTIVSGFVANNFHLGKPFFNSVLVAQGGQAKRTPLSEGFEFRQKILLPTYDVFVEDRYFEPGRREFPVVDIKGVKVGIIICEEAWNDPSFWKNCLYDVDPVAEYATNGAKYIISINASPYRMGVVDQRHNMIAAHCRTHNIGFCYVNQVGYNDDVGFDGNSFAMNESGKIIFHAAAWDEDVIIFNTDAKPIPISAYEVEWEKEVLSAVTTGVKDYWNKLGIKGPAIIGLSGGIDSALVAAIAVGALGAKNVIGVGMPSEFSSYGSVSDAEKIAKTLDIHFALMSIKTAHHNIRFALDNINRQLITPFTQFLTLFGSRMESLENSGVPDENIQARIRGIYLMGLANYYNGIVLSTGNKSEMAVGYCVDGDSVIWTDQGMKTARELHDFVKNGNKCGIGDNYFTNAYKSIKQRIVTIATQVSSKLIVSADHEIEVFDTENRVITFRKAGEIKEGDIISMRIGSNIWGINLELPKFKYQKKEFDFKSFDFEPPSELSFDLAKFIGLCVADGSFSGNGTYRIRAAKDDVSTFCGSFLPSLKLPNSSWKITEKDENGCFFIEICSVQFNAWLKILGVLHGAYNKLIPDCIANAPAKMVKGFLSGVMMDSTTNLKHKFGEVVYHSVNDKLVDTVHDLLLNLGICSYRRAYNKPYLTETYMLYEVYIPASETIKLIDGFDFLKPSIKERIIANNETTRLRHKSFVDGIYGHDEKIQTLLDDLSWKDRSILRNIIQTTGCIGRKTLAKYIGNSKNPQNHEALSKVINSDNYYAKVIDINIVETEREMFDFSMSYEPVYTVGGYRVHNCTLYGDMAGGLSPISDLYKTKVFKLARWFNDISRMEIIPENSISKHPSAELRENQKDQDSLPPYEMLDIILERFVEGEKTADEIVAEIGQFPEQMQYRVKFNRNLEEDIYWVCQTVIRNEFKRKQAPTGLRLTSKLFRLGWEYPIVHKMAIRGVVKHGASPAFPIGEKVGV